MATRDVKIHSSTLRGPDDDIQTVLNLIEDISDKKDTQAKLRHSEER